MCMVCGGGGRMSRDGFVGGSVRAGRVFAQLCALRWVIWPWWVVCEDLMTECG